MQESKKEQRGVKMKATYIEYSLCRSSVGEWRRRFVEGQCGEDDVAKISVGNARTLTYSLDLSPCDFHVFGTLKRAIHGHRFATNDEVSPTAGKGHFEVCSKLIKYLWCRFRRR
ncbi:hypothetical protein TNCV_5029901 [Trichonephila clavipes]|nr:hypothetical protein TNCV_5029901 [Trichonephila clavipes]